MSSTQARGEPATETSRARTVDMKLEVVVLPVSDVARAAEFYGRLGWRRDADIVTGDRRVLQFTPPGSPCSIIFATGVTPSAFGLAKFLHLVVSDIETAREELIRKGVEASEIFHDVAEGYNPFETEARASGPDPTRRSYLSFVAFSDPDGNGWLLQEVTSRLPGRIDSTRRASHPRRIWRARSAVRRPHTANTRSAPVNMMRIGRTGTPRTWWRNTPAISCRYEQRLVP